MSFLRSTLIADARQFADAENSTRWTDAFLLRLADAAFRREWSGILNANRFYRADLRVPTMTLDGTLARATCALSALDDGTGDTVEKLYRIIAVKADDRVYQQVELDSLPGAVTSAAGAYGALYWITGSTLNVSPLSTATAASILVNHTPAAPSSLAADASTVVFPDGYEMILSLETAAMMLAKGGAETDASRDLRSLAGTLRDDMLADISRFTTNPLQMRHSDSASDWGCR